MNEPKIRIGLPDAETLLYLLYALYCCPPDVLNKVYTEYQMDIIEQLNIDPSTL
nr:MAG TPA: hypothetical protein [Caudoviricetes sp.]